MPVNDRESLRRQLLRLESEILALRNAPQDDFSELRAVQLRHLREARLSTLALLAEMIETAK